MKLSSLLIWRGKLLNMSKVKNIVMIISNDSEPKCGGDMYFYELIKYFRRKDSKLVVIGFNSISNKIKRSRVVCNLWFFFIIAKHKKAIIIQEAYFKNYLVICNILTRIFTRSKIVIFIQELRRFPVSGIRRVCSKMTLRCFLKTADIVIGNSEYLRREVISENYPEKRVFCIPPSYQKLTGPTDEKKNKKNEHITILCVGNYREIKGQKYLIEALKMINNSSVILYLVGSPDRDYPYYLNLKDQVIKYSLEKQVFFTGWLQGKDLARMYLSADIFVLPSIYEAYGIVLLEAMSFALPIVASKVGGISEIVKNGENGFLSLPSNPSALASALLKLIESKELRVTLGERGYEMLKSLPNWEFVCTKFYETIDTIIK